MGYIIAKQKPKEAWESKYLSLGFNVDVFETVCDFRTRFFQVSGDYVFGILDFSSVKENQENQEMIHLAKDLVYANLPLLICNYGNENYKNHPLIIEKNEKADGQDITIPFYQIESLDKSISHYLKAIFCDETLLPGSEKGNLKSIINTLLIDNYLC
jgi:hypothetical protein